MRDMDCLREKQEELKKTEISDIENRMNSQITTLIKNHNKALSDMEAYFSNSTQESESAYKSLKVRLITHTPQPLPH